MTIEAAWSVDSLPTAKLRMVSDFQCCGCARGGPDPRQCTQYKLDRDWGDASFRCIGHMPGAWIAGGPQIYLGMPRGFNRVGQIHYAIGESLNTSVRLWVQGTAPAWDHCNVPVWAMELDGHLFVRTYLPRTNRSYVDVIAGGKLAQLPASVFDVGTIYGEID